MPTLSVIMITKNAEDSIRRALTSVKFANEIIIIDSGSTDQTLKICREYTSQLFVKDWPGFGPQKNRALAKAQCDWVLSLDADEYLTPELATEIQAAITSQDASAFSLPRQSSYCGQRIAWGDWRGDRVVRLFRRGEAEFSPDLVHEHLCVKGKTAKLTQALQHESFRSLEQVIDTMNRYSTLGATMKKTAEKKAGLTTAISHGLWTFIRGYILRLGFLDGKAGYMLAVSNAQGCYYRYLKLMLLNR